MKSLKTIGVAKAIRFVLWELFKHLLAFSFVPPVRGFLLRIAGASVGADTVILNAVFVNAHHYGFRPLRIGRQCFIADEVLLDLRGGIILEDGVTISNRTSIVTHINVGYPDHPLQKSYPTKEAPVRIKRGAYIGTGAIILPGIVIGRSSVVGAGAVVTRNVPDNTVVAGVPAKHIKRIA